MAYAALGITYGTAREHELAAQFSQRAFELRDRVSEREKFYISVRYYMDVLDDGDRAIEVLELWKQTYPRDFVPRTNLAARYGAIGRYREALDEAREGLRLNADAGVAYAAVANTLISLGQLGEARNGHRTGRGAEADPPYSHYMLTRLRSCRSDAAAMQQQIDRVSGTPAEAGMLAMQSVTAAYAGRVRQARELTNRAMELAKGRGLDEAAGVYAAGHALWEAAYGNCHEADHAATRALALSRGRHALSWSALAVAICGDSIRAGKLADEMVRRFPENSFFNSSWLPMVQAAARAPSRRSGRCPGAIEESRARRAGHQRGSLAGVSSRPGLPAAGCRRERAARIPEDSGPQGRARTQGLQSRGDDAAPARFSRPRPRSRAQRRCGREPIGL